MKLFEVTNSDICNSYAHGAITSDKRALELAASSRCGDNSPLTIDVSFNAQINIKDIYSSIENNHEHSFIECNDGSRDKVCVICGKRAMQGVICLSVK